VTPTTETSSNDKLTPLQILLRISLFILAIIFAVMAFATNAEANKDAFTQSVATVIQTYDSAQGDTVHDNVLGQYLPMIVVFSLLSLISFIVFLCLFIWPKSKRVSVAVMSSSTLIINKNGLSKYILILYIDGRKCGEIPNDPWTILLDSGRHSLRIESDLTSTGDSRTFNYEMHIDVSPNQILEVDCIYDGHSSDHPLVLSLKREGNNPINDDVSGRTNSIKQCPMCAEDIKLAAIVCKHCGHKFEKIAIL
jgi:hypothetical protein